MAGSTETQFTATGPAAAGFRTLPADTATQFDIGAHVSGLNIGGPIADLSPEFCTG